MRYGSTLSDTHATRDHPPQPGLGTGLEAVKCHRAQASRAGSVTPRPQVHTWKHHQTGLRDLPWDGDSSSSPWDTKCQPRPVPELAADHVGGWAFSALARVAFCRGSLHCGGCSVHHSGCSGIPGLHLPGASNHWVTSAPVPLTRAHDNSQQATPKANAYRASSLVALCVAKRRILSH